MYRVRYLLSDVIKKYMLDYLEDYAILFYTELMNSILISICMEVFSEIFFFLSNVLIEKYSSF
jgi:hypothetical protein